MYLLAFLAVIPVGMFVNRLRTHGWHLTILILMIQVQIIRVAFLKWLRRWFDMSRALEPLCMAMEEIAEEHRDTLG